MKIWIVCTGESADLWPKRCDAAAFEGAAGRAGERMENPEPGKRLNAEGKTVYYAPSPAARQTAELCFEGGALQEEPLLKPVALRAFRSGGRYAPEIWRKMAALQRSLGAARQPESQKQLSRRAEALVARLVEKGEDCMLVADTVLTGALMDRLRAHGCDVSRSEIFRFRPWEKILVTDRSLRCGGCGHNCLLSNPGCARGLDKARRIKRKDRGKER